MTTVNLDIMRCRQIRNFSCIILNSDLKFHRDDDFKLYDPFVVLVYNQELVDIKMMMMLAVGLYLYVCKVLVTTHRNMST